MSHNRNFRLSGANGLGTAYAQDAVESVSDLRGLREDDANIGLGGLGQSSEALRIEQLGTAYAQNAVESVQDLRGLREDDANVQLMGLREQDANIGMGGLREDDAKITLEGLRRSFILRGLREDDASIALAGLREADAAIELELSGLREDDAGVVLEGLLGETDDDDDDDDDDELEGLGKFGRGRGRGYGPPPWARAYGRRRKGPRAKKLFTPNVRKAVKRARSDDAKGPVIRVLNTARREIRRLMTDIATGRTAAPTVAKVLDMASQRIQALRDRRTPVVMPAIKPVAMVNGLGEVTFHERFPVELEGFFDFIKDAFGAGVPSDEEYLAGLRIVIQGWSRAKPQLMGLPAQSRNAIIANMTAAKCDVERYDGMSAFLAQGAAAKTAGRWERVQRLQAYLPTLQNLIDKEKALGIDAPRPTAGPRPTTETPTQTQQRVNRDAIQNVNDRYNATETANVWTNTVLPVGGAVVGTGVLLLIIKALASK